MSFVSSNYLIYLLVLIPLFWIYKGSLVNRDLKKVRLSFALRTLGIGLLVLALCRPFMPSQSHDRHLIFLFDTSHSIELKKLKESAQETLKQIKELPSSDSTEIYLFAQKLIPVAPDKLIAKIDEIAKNLSDTKERSASLISSSLALSRLHFPAGKQKILCLFSDGIETQEKSLLKTLDTLKKEKIQTYFSTIPGLKQAETAITSFSINPPYAYQGETVRLKAQVKANIDSSAILSFSNNGIKVHSQKISLKKDQFKNVFADISLTKEMSKDWQVEIEAEHDSFPMNNTLHTSLPILGQSKVLALHEKPAKLNDFRRALAKQGIDIEVRNHLGIPTTLEEFNQFNAVIVADIPATKMTQKQMKTLRSYVQDCGGGFIMTGSKNSFGLGGYYKTPIEDILPVSSKFEKDKEHPSLALVLVIDKSGSMGGIPIELARQASKASVEVLGAKDKVAVIAFDGSAHTVVEMQSASSKMSIKETIESIQASGGTNLYPAMLQGQEMLQSSASKLKHMIILSDGQSSGGDFEGISSEMAASGMTISTVSLGDGAAVGLMAHIAEIGRGRAYVTNDPMDMPQIFTKETMEASSSAIKEEPFMPIAAQDTSLFSQIDLSEAPFLLGYVMTKLKAATNVALLTEQGDPLLVNASFGTGQSVAFTSDLTDTWSSEWLEWEQYGQFWAQIIRGLSNEQSQQLIRTEVADSNGQKSLLISAFDSLNQAESKLSWDAALIDQNGQKTSLTVSPDGLGKYRCEFQAPAKGDYSIRLHDQSNNRVKNIFFNDNYPKEYQLNKKIDQSLAQTAKYDKLENIKTTGLRSFDSVFELFAILGIISILGSILIRRI